jgi:hypothetical protein
MSDKKKRPYTKPIVKELGTVAALTQTSGTVQQHDNLTHLNGSRS